MGKYFLGLSSNYSAGDTLRHTFATGTEYDLSELRAFLAAHYGATFDHAAVYGNGRTALNVAVKELVKRGGKVVVTSLTCYAVVQAIKNAGCVPIFADINKETLHFGPKELEKAIEGEQNVQAVLVQNNLGIPADMEGIEAVAKAHKLIIIEDLAHCAGVKYADGREAGTVGRAAILSFGKGKSIDSVTGGAVIFSDPLDPPVNQPGEPPVFKENFRARFYPLFSAIIRGGYRLHQKIGRGLTAGLIKIHAIKRSADGEINQNTRLSFWQCKMALRQLKAMPHRGRKPLREFYLVDDRDEVLKKLSKAGYELYDFWYEVPVSPKRYFHKADFHPDACPVASEVATQIINLPTWYDRDDMRPALRIIKKHLVAEDAISEDELAISEKEKYQQEIEADKKAKRDATKKAVKEKLDKVAPKEIIKVAKKKKADATKKAEEKKEKAEKTREELEKEKAEKKEQRKEEKKQKEIEKREKISKERDDSGLLLAMDKAKAEEKPEPEEKKEVKKEEASKAVAKQSFSTASSPASEATYIPDASEASQRMTSPSESGAVENDLRATKPKSSSKNTSTGAMPGMSVAPKKLSEREKLKQELESGKKEERSVF